MYFRLGAHITNQELTFYQPALQVFGLEGKGIPALLRRRLTKLARVVVESISLLEEKRDAPQEQLSWVCASRYGDMERIYNMLAAIKRGDVLSPTDFSLSVYNAIIGVSSIATHNTKPHTTVSSIHDCLLYGLLEAYGKAKSHMCDVGLIYYDQTPGQYLFDNQGDTPQIEAFLCVISPSYHVGDLKLELSFSKYKGNEKEAPPLKSLVEFLRKTDERVCRLHAEKSDMCFVIERVDA